MRRLFVIMTASVLLIALLIIIFPNKSNLSDKIIKYIDNKGDKNNVSIIKLNEITGFKWDKMLIYQVGSSRKAISKALGVEYKDSVDLMSGIIFVYNNKIVYEERIPYNPERPGKLNWYPGNGFDTPNYRVFTSDDAIFRGSSNKIDGKTYYKVEPLKTNQ